MRRRAWGAAADRAELARLARGFHVPYVGPVAKATIRFLTAASRPGSRTESSQDLQFQHQRTWGSWNQVHTSVGKSLGPPGIVLSAALAAACWRSSGLAGRVLTDAAPSRLRPRRNNDLPVTSKVEHDARSIRVRAYRLGPTGSPEIDVPRQVPALQLVDLPPVSLAGVERPSAPGLSRAIYSPLAFPPRVLIHEPNMGGTR